MSRSHEQKKQQVLGTRMAVGTADWEKVPRVASSETQEQSVGSGKKARRKFSSTALPPVLKTFVAPFLPTRLTAPESPRVLAPSFIIFG